MTVRRLCAIAVVLIAVLACSQQSPQHAQATATQTGQWALAVHGGAGNIPRDLPKEERDAYIAGLTVALDRGVAVLDGGGTALDAVEKVVLTLEEDDHFNAGRGAVFTHEGRHELDAAIMDGRDRSCGSVAGVTTVRNPIHLARLVMERSPHVFMAGPGAEAFALSMGLEPVENSFFDTQKRRQQLEKALAEETAREGMGTVGAVALDRTGHLAAATSTGGLTNKRWGRIGDVPVIGAGTFADDASCALSATGQGEQFIRHTVTGSVAARVELAGMDLERAAHQVLFDILRPGDGGLIGVSRSGKLVLLYSTPAMLRGLADSSGRREVSIWD